MQTEQSDTPDERRAQHLKLDDDQKPITPWAERSG